MAVTTEVIFELRNAETLEVEETFTKCNTILVGNGLNRLRVSRENYVSFLTQDYWKYNLVTYAYNTQLYLCTHDYSANPGTYRYLAAHNVAANTMNQQWSYVDSSPPYWEASFRFNVPATEKIWKGATLHQDMTHIRINPPCVQSTTQVLDVRYRIFRDESLIDGDSTTLEENAGKFYFKNFTRTLTQNDTNSNHASIANAFKLNYREQTWIRSGYDNYDDRYSLHDRNGHTYDKRQGRYKNTFGISKGSQIGAIHNSLVMCGDYGYTFSKYILNHSERVSTIHHHSVTSDKPYEDIDNLSSSGGLPTVINNAVDNGLPEFLQVHYVGDGQVGVSKYMLRSQRTIGTRGNSYNRSGKTASTNMGCLTGFSALGPGNHQTNTAHGCANHRFNTNKVELTPNQWVSYSRIGLTVTDFTNDLSVDFDPDNHGFTPTNISVVVTDFNTKTIYVACTGTGIWRITDPFGVPTVANFSPILNGIQAGGALHVDVGYNSRVWAYFDGDLMYSDDLGESWVSNNATNGLFSFAGLTGAGEWTRCRDMVCDRVDPGHIVALMIDSSHPSVARLRILFYHANDKSYVLSAGDFQKYQSQRDFGGSSYADGLGGSGPSGTSEYAKGMLKVSKRHSVWTLTAAASKGETYLSTYSINAYTGNHLHGLNSYYYYTSTASGFMYDNFDVPIYQAGNSFSRGVYTANRLLMDDVNFSAYRAADIDWFQTINSESTIECKAMVYNAWIGAAGNLVFRDAQVDNISFIDRHGGGFNLKNSRFEDMAWNEYVWNGSSFVNKATWMQDAVDSTGTHNATRKNFRINSYMFYGRQYLDITGNAPTVDKITMVATYTPITKPDQGYDNHHTLFDMQFSDKDWFSLYTREDATTIKTIRINALNNEVFQGTTILDDNVTYRIMLTIDGTSAKVYVNGILDIDMTLSQAPNFSIIDILAIGAHTKIDNYWTYLPHPELFLSGEVLNIQVWDDALTQIDATNDAADITGIVAPEFAALTALTGHFQMNEPLSEARTTHSTQLPLTGDLEISFTDAPTGQSFTDTDYHTMTVCDGILSDNTNSFNYTLDSYIHPTDRKYSVLNNQKNPAVVPNTPVEVVGAKMMFGTDAYAISTLHGYAVSTYDGITTSQYGRVTSFNRFDGEVMIEFQPHHETNYASIGFAPLKMLVSEESQLKYSVRTNSNRFISIYEDGVNISPDIAPFTVDSVFRIRRLVTGAFSLHSVEPTTGVETLIHESSVGHIYQGPAFVGILAWGQRGGFYNIRYSCTLRNNLAFIGHLTDATGIYHEDFTATSSRADDLKMNIDGVDIAVSILSADDLDNMIPLSAGEVRYFYNMGMLEFSTADFGKPLQFYTDVIHYPG